MPSDFDDSIYYRIIVIIYDYYRINNYYYIEQFGLDGSYNNYYYPVCV